MVFNLSILVSGRIITIVPFFIMEERTAAVYKCKPDKLATKIFIYLAISSRVRYTSHGSGCYGVSFYNLSNYDTERYRSLCVLVFYRLKTADMICIDYRLFWARSDWNIIDS